MRSRRVPPEGSLASVRPQHSLCEPPTPAFPEHELRSIQGHSEGDENMQTKNWKYGVIAAIAAAGLTFTGCKETARGVEADAEKAGQSMERGAERGTQAAESGAQDLGNATEREANEAEGTMRGTGGAGEAADDGPDIGNRKGVINDGEGPLERGADGKIGDRKGVINDGEGPLEKREQPQQQQ